MIESMFLFYLPSHQPSPLEAPINRAFQTGGGRKNNNNIREYREFIITI